MKFRTYLHLTQIIKIFVLSGLGDLSELGDFVVCSTNLYIFEVVESISKV